MLTVIENVCWAIVPARGGSKSVPLKNLAPFAGRPLVDHVLAAAADCDEIGRVIVSTDHPEIAKRGREMGAEVHDRPAALGGDDTPVIAVIDQLVRDIAAREDGFAEFFALLQPTSPFVTADHIAACVAALRADAAAGSAQTVVVCPHNQHAINQRVVDGGYVSFRFEAERAAAFNKQRKPRHYLFGNLIVARTRMALEQGSPFPTPSVPVPIPNLYGFDADGPEDFRLGEAILAAGLVTLTNNR